MTDTIKLFDTKIIYLANIIIKYKYEKVKSVNIININPNSSKSNSNLFSFFYTNG